MRQKFLLIICLIIIFVGAGYSMAVQRAKSKCVDIEGKTTILANLYDRIGVGNFENQSENIYTLINTSQITGMSKLFKKGLDLKKIDYFYSHNIFPTDKDVLAISALPTKVCSPLRPVLNHYELFEYEGKCYIKLYFVIDKKNGDGYGAVYVYDDLDVNYIKEELAKLG